MTVIETRLGQTLTTTPASPRAHTGSAWRLSETAPVLPAADVDALHAAGEVPRPEQLLQVTVSAGEAGDWVLRVVVPYVSKPPEELELPFDAEHARLDERGCYTASFLFVHGAPASDVSFPWIRVLDVTEATALGHAPRALFSFPGSPAAPVTLGPPDPGPQQVRARMLGLGFETDKAFLLPEAVPALKRLRRIWDAQPGAVVVSGHSDTTGAEAHNLTLADERAAAAAAYLRDDVDAWLPYYTSPPGVSKPWGTREDQHMLSALPDGEAPFYAGPVDGIAGPQTQQAVRDFQAGANAQGAALAVDGICGPLTRSELIRHYMGIDGTSLPEGTELTTHGCGEHHPLEPTGDGVASAENRRVEFFIFPDGAEPPAPAPPAPNCPAGGCAEYPAWVVGSQRTIDLGAELAALTVRVLDAGGAPIEAADVQLDGPEARAERSGPDGEARFAELLPGGYRLVGAKQGFAPGSRAIQVGGSKAKAAPEAKQTFAEGDASAKDPDADAETLVLFRVPVIETFRGFAVPEAGQPAPPAERFGFEQGEEIRLEWTVRGTVDSVVLTGGEGVEEELLVAAPPEKLLTQNPDGSVSGSFQFDPRDLPPVLATGRYELNAEGRDPDGAPFFAFHGLVHVHSVVAFQVVADQATPHALLDRQRNVIATPPIQGEPDRLPLPAGNTPESNGKIRGFFQRARKNPGQVPSKLDYSWDLIGGEGVRLVFQTQHNGTQAITEAEVTPDAVHTVTDANNPHMLQIDAALAVLDDQGTFITGHALRLAKNLPAVEIEDFHPTRVTDPGLPATFTFTGWEGLGFAWKVSSTAREHALHLRVVLDDDPSVVLIDEQIKPIGERPAQLSKTRDFRDADPRRLDVESYTCRATVTLGPIAPSASPSQPLADTQVHTFTISRKPSALLPTYEVSLSDALAQANGSMLHFATGPLVEVGKGAEPLEAAPITDPPGTPEAEESIWTWRQSGLAAVEDVRCVVHGHHTANALVTTRIDWREVAIVRSRTIDPSGTRIALPLTAPFLVNRFTLERGRLEDRPFPGFYWKLETELDQSMMLVFGYRLDPGSTTPIPFDLDAETPFLPFCPAPAPQTDPSRPAGGAVDPDEPLRVVVCLTLACTKMRNDFEPGGVNFAGRLLPMIHVTASQDLARAHGTVRVQRPAESTPPHHDEHGEMHAAIGPVLFTDTNAPSRMKETFNGFQGAVLEELGKLLNLGVGWEENPATLYAVGPYWSTFFDYYDFPTDGHDFVYPRSHVVVDHAATGTFEPTLSILSEGILPLSTPEYKPFPLKKEPGQGEFDNLHMAPLMRLPETFKGQPLLTHPQNLAKFDNPAEVGRPPAGESWNMTEIAMAPFCVHDCLHTHWRWGTELSRGAKSISTKGWDGFNPHAKLGAPTVPSNQRVVLNLLDARTFENQVTAFGVEAGRWQVMHHNGLGYALKLAPESEAGVPILLNSQSELHAEPQLHDPTALHPHLPTTELWSFRYWRMRFGGSSEQPMERIKFSLADLASYRSARVASPHAAFKEGN